MLYKNKMSTDNVFWRWQRILKLFWKEYKPSISCQASVLWYLVLRLAEASLPDAVSNVKRPMRCLWSPGSVTIARWHVSYFPYNLITAHGMMYIHGILLVMSRESDQPILHGLPIWHVSHIWLMSFYSPSLPPKNSGFFQQLWKEPPGIALIQEYWKT